MKTIFYRVMKISVVAIIASLSGKLYRFQTRNLNVLTKAVVIDVCAVIIIRWVRLCLE